MIEKNKEVDYSYVTFYRDKTGEVLRYKFGRCLSDCTSDFKVYLDENKNLRNQFLESEFENIRERIEGKFGSEVMIFLTHLNPIKTRI